MYAETIGDFYARWEGLDKLDPNSRKAREEQWGYKSKVIRLIARLLGLQATAVRQWGKGLEAKIPPRHQPQLNLLLMEQRYKEVQKAVQLRDERIRYLEAQISRLQNKRVA